MSDFIGHSHLMCVISACYISTSILFIMCLFFLSLLFLFQVNLKKFLAVCSELGLSGWQLFDPNDLEVGGDVM